MTKLPINMKEILSPAHGNFEKQNMILEPSIIVIDYCIVIIIIIIIIINEYYNYVLYIMHSTVTAFLQKAFSRKAIRRIYGCNWGCYYFLFEKQTVKRSVQCHVFAQSPPGQHPNGKYPVNTSSRSRFLLICFIQCYLVAMVIHVQSIRSQICMLYVCIYIYIYIYTGCPRRNVPDFGRVFLMLKYTDIIQNTYVQS